MKKGKLTNAEYIAEARAQYHDEGTIEVDDKAKLSRSPDNDGAYVQAWVWVARADVIAAREAS